MTAIASPEGGMSRGAFLLLLGTATAFAVPAVRYFSQLDSGEISQEREAQREIERNKNQRRITIVDDDDISAGILAEFITTSLTGANVSYYLTCQDLLKQMDSGRRYEAYVVDFNPGDTEGFWGDVCTQQILIRHPGAVVIGQSMADVGEKFIKAGAQKFISRREGGMVIANIIKNLLP